MSARVESIDGRRLARKSCSGVTSGLRPWLQFWSYSRPWRYPC